MKSKYLQWGFGAILIGIANAVTIDDGIKLGATNTVPTGSNSIAAGDGNSANNFSMAFGYYNYADNCSLSIGAYNTIMPNSYFSAAIGDSNFSESNVSTTLIGNGNTLGFQEGSAAIGASNMIRSVTGKSGIGNVLIGSLNQIDQRASSAPDNIQGTVLLGVNNESSSTMAFAFGKGNIGQTETVTLGTYAQTVSDASLIVGNGTGASNRSNGLVVLKSGEVQIPGSLVVGGSPTLSQGSASSFLQNQGFVNTSYLSSNGYLKRVNGTNASAETSAYLAMGTNAQASGHFSWALGSGANATSYGSIAFGENSLASANYAMAIQGGQAEGVCSFAASYGYANGEFALALSGGFATAEGAISIGGYDSSSCWGNDSSGSGSVAIGGLLNSAIGDCAFVSGRENYALGDYSFASGRLTRAMAYDTVFGSKNLSSGNALYPMSTTEWQEEGALFELGNGHPQSPTYEVSNAITTRKNGQTTLTNKEWKAHSTTPLADPDSTTDSGGEALVVEGHARLKGKVIIEQAQGDISMGIYGN